MQLHFRQLGDGEMDRPPTQRDQFNNDDVDLVDALVRESLQNSLDAAAGDTVRVRFSLHRQENAGREALLTLLDLGQLRQRLDACAIDPDSIGFADPKLLVIEDFGTTGLTGSWTSMDQEPFSDFWRRMGKSHKAGRSLGRWGLGKLVFSSSSKARIFFGLTVREVDPENQLLMGQAVLTTHELDAGQRFDSHGFFCRLSETGMQLPITDTDGVRGFATACGVSRTDEPGLSIVVPYVVESITEQRIVQAVLQNYFFPILLGRLVVTVGAVTIDDGSFAELARAHGGARFANGALAQFISTMRSVRKGEREPHVLPSTWASTGIAAALGDHTNSLRERYQAGECLCVRAPFLLKQKDGVEFTTKFDLFLQKVEVDGDTLFVRDTIVLPAEAKYFRGYRTLAALVADDKPICTFLGDAENPAHTSWSASAEKVNTQWRNPSARLKEVRGALQQLHDEIVSSLEVIDPNALIDFFSAKSETGARGSRPRGPVARAPNPNPPPPTEKSYRLVRLKGGFAIRGAASLKPEQLPVTIRVRAAYDVLRGNPFSKHDALDFDFSKNELVVNATGAKALAESPNTLIIKASSRDFEVRVDGFDVRRDLIIDASRK
jgi:hypothetical protein